MKQAIGIVCVLLWLALLAIHFGWFEPPHPLEPPPFPADKISVLILEETSDRGSLPRSQQEILQSVRLLEWLKSHDVDYRMWDADQEARFAEDKWRQALAKPRDSLPWILISNGKTGVSCPLPESVDATIALIEKYL